MSAIGRIYARILACLLPLAGQDIVIEGGVSIHPLAVIGAGGGRIRIGPGCDIHRGAMLLAYKGEIRLGSNVSVNPYSMLYGHGGLLVGNDVRIASHAVIIPADHVFSDRSRPIVAQGETRRGIAIGNDVWVATGARILDDVRVADGCVIAAGAVVTKSTDAYGVYAGVPARRVRDR